MRARCSPNDDKQRPRHGGGNVPNYLHLPAQIDETQTLIAPCGGDWAIFQVGSTLSCCFLPFPAVLVLCARRGFPTCKLNPIIARPTMQEPSQLEAALWWIHPGQAANPISTKICAVTEPSAFSAPPTPILDFPHNM